MTQINPSNNFNKHLWFAMALVIGFLAGCNPSHETSTKQNVNVSAMETSDRQLRHVVLFKFKPGTDPAAITQVEVAFAALPSKIPEIRDFEWGLNNSPEDLNKGFTHCFLVTFDSEEDRAVYLPHPDHQAFVGLLSDILEDVTVIDYWTSPPASE